MKKGYIVFFALISTLGLFAQAPQSISYQAVVRNASGSIIANTQVGMKISILADSATGTAVCVEEFTPTTNDYGLVTLQIGSSNTTDFEAIDWSYQDYFVKVELDPEGGTSYTEMGTSQLLSVPYALYAKNAGENLYFKNGNIGIGTNNPARRLTVNGETSSGYIAYQTDATGNTANDGFLTGIKNSSSLAYIWNYENAGISIGTNNSQQMVIDKEGDVGIGVSNPTSKLQVTGDSKFGTHGVAFDELREITGTTSATFSYALVSLPSSYTESNTRILSLEINYLGDRWIGLGNDNINEGNNSVTYLINGSTLYIYYPNLTSYKDRAFRVLMMKIHE
jgi:hypothetical protein